MHDRMPDSASSIASKEWTEERTEGGAERRRQHSGRSGRRSRTGRGTADGDSTRAAVEDKVEEEDGRRRRRESRSGLMEAGEEEKRPNEEEAAAAELSSIQTGCSR